MSVLTKSRSLTVGLPIYNWAGQSRTNWTGSAAYVPDNNNSLVLLRHSSQIIVVAQVFELVSMQEKIFMLGGGGREERGDNMTVLGIDNCVRSLREEYARQMPMGIY